MKPCSGAPGPRGFTLIELLTALAILSLLALMSYRGLGAVLDARDHVEQETEKWQRVATFFARFQRDVQLSAPRPVRAAPAAPGVARTRRCRAEPRLEFSRFATAEGIDAPRRVAYRLNEQQEIELWLWPGLDVAPGAAPTRYAVLPAVAQFELQYLDARSGVGRRLARSQRDPPLPRAVRLRIVLASGEELVRVFALQS